jgi:hypothetical protein
LAGIFNLRFGYTPNVLQDKSTLGGGGSTVGTCKDFVSLVPLEMKDVEVRLEVFLQTGVDARSDVGGKEGHRDSGITAVITRRLYDNSTARSAVGRVLATPLLTLGLGCDGNGRRVLWRRARLECRCCDGLFRGGSTLDDWDGGAGRSGRGYPGPLGRRSWRRRGRRTDSRRRSLSGWGPRWDQTSEHVVECADRTVQRDRDLKESVIAGHPLDEFNSDYSGVDATVVDVGPIDLHELIDEKLKKSVRLVLGSPRRRGGGGERRHWKPSVIHALILFIGVRQSRG